MKNLIAVKKIFKNENGNEIPYTNYYLYLQNILGNYEFVQIKVVGDRVSKMALDASAMFFDNLVSARDYMIENYGE